jgi:hypothetical protein
VPRKSSRLGRLAGSVVEYVIFLPKLYILDINILKLSSNPLILTYNKPNYLLIVILYILELTYVELKFLKESLEHYSFFTYVFKCNKLSFSS